MSSPAPSFNIDALAGEWQTMTGGGDASKGLTFTFCSDVILGVINDPNFNGVNDDDIRQVLGLMDTGKLQQLEAQFAYTAQAVYDLTKLAAAAEPVGAPPSYGDLLQDAKTNVNALQPAKFTF